MSDWNPNDPALTSHAAPHELGAILRWHRANVPSQEILKMLGMRGTKLIAAIEKSSGEELIAEKMGLPVHAPLFDREDRD